MISDQVGEPITIEEAYNELSQQAFAVWMRLMIAHPRELIGRRKIAKMVNYSSSYCDTILRELKHKGYVKFEKAPPGKPSKLIIFRRALLSGPSSFITLTNTMFGNYSENASATPIQLMRNEGGKKPSKKSKKNCDSIHHSSASSSGGAGSKKMSKAEEPPGTPKKKQKSRRKRKTRNKGSSQKPRKETAPRSGNKKSSQTRVKAPKEPPTPIESSQDRSTGEDLEKGGAAIERKGVSISKFREKFREIKKERGEKRKKKKSEIRTSTAEPPINWNKLDHRGAPSISFSPSGARRQAMIEVLERSDRDSSKRALLKKLSSEFGRIYSRYRRMLQKQRGHQPVYILPKQERKYAARAAEWCIRKELTPRQVLEYWHENIGNFANSKMGIPPLVFLSGPANIDTVACALLEEPKKAPVNVGHGFSDESQLDRRLRPGLERAGFETHLFNDRYLLTIQKTAQAIAKGAKLFVGAEMKPMVSWAARNLYEN